MHTEIDPLPALIHAYRMRSEYLRAELRLNNQIKALQRRASQTTSDTQRRLARSQTRGQVVPDIQYGLAPFEGGSGLAPSVIPTILAGTSLTSDLERHMTELGKERKRWEKNLSQIAKSLPLWTWGQGILGLGPLSFGQLMAEVGDPTSYSNPAKLWKRMGLAVFEGQAQRRSTNKDLAIQMGYSPTRRTVAYLIGENLIRKKSPGYYTLYLERKAYEAPRELTKLHAHRRASRYMVKRLLKDLWRQAREAKTD